MKELSKETIEIDGKEYTLFLNRSGIVAWEQYTEKEKGKFEELGKKYKDIINTKTNDFDELPDDANPFESIEGFDSDVEFFNNIYSRLYWIMLYTEHKLSISEAKALYDKACEEYGEAQIMLLAKQMIDEVNTNPEKPLKNLAALKPTTR